MQESTVCELPCFPGVLQALFFIFLRAFKIRKRENIPREKSPLLILERTKQYIVPYAVCKNSKINQLCICRSCLCLKNLGEIQKYLKNIENGLNKCDL